MKHTTWCSDHASDGGEMELCCTAYTEMNSEAGQQFGLWISKDQGEREPHVYLDGSRSDVRSVPLGVARWWLRAYDELGPELFDVLKAHVNQVDGMEA